MIAIKLVTFGLLASLLYTAGLAQTNPPALYRNPVIAGDFADPSVIRVGDTFYAAGTSSEWAPAYPVYRSADLVNWQYVGPVFKQQPAWTVGSYWAPELYYRDGTFYVYYTARRKSDRRSYIGVATSRDPESGFTDHGCLLEWTTEAIDAFIIEDAGKRYITWKAYGLDKGKTIQILGRELTADGLGVTGEVFTLLQAQADGWEAGGAEGQAIFKRGRYFYMTYSGNACCGTGCNYQVGLARALKLQGPWEKYAGNPVLRGDQTWKCPGHGTVVTTADNRYFYLHHAYSSAGFTFTGRQGLLSELVWDEKTGWPAFRYGTAPPGQAESPLGAAQQQEPGFSADFASGNPALPWVWDVSQPQPGFSLGQGYLQLSAGNTQQPAGSFLGLVVKKGTYAFSATITPQDQVLQSICVYGDANNAIGLAAGKDSLELWQVKEGKRQVLRKQPLPPGSKVVTLLLRGRQGGFYEFGWGVDAAAIQPVAQPALDGAFLPRWDRAPRIGISVKGKSEARGMFRSVALQYD